MKAFVVVVRDLILVIINTYTFPSSTIDLSLLWKGGRFRAVATAPLSTCATITFGTARPIAVRSPLGRINMLLFARLVQRLMRLRHEDGQIERFYMGRFPIKEVSKKSFFRPFCAFQRGPPLSTRESPFGRDEIVFRAPVMHSFELCRSLHLVCHMMHKYLWHA